MGVHDLWKLLGPCGHRISLDTISRRKLAIDVSIWLNQFVKFLPTSQPHLLGLLRRLCKLHFYHIKPVFVFDGPAPMLKKRTIQSRRKIRARQQDSFERMAERILLEQLKLKSLKDLRKKLEKPKKSNDDSIDDSRKQDDDNDVSIIDENDLKSIRDIAKSQLDEIKEDDELDEDADMQLLRTLQAEEYSTGFAEPDEIDYGQSPVDSESVNATRSSPMVLPSSDEEDDTAPLRTYDSVNYELPESGELDATVLASLPISVQYELLDQHRQHHHTLSMRKYAAVKHDMNAFSSMQMQSFLKHVQFNQEIDRKRQEMNATHSRNGMPVRRLAGDSRKEFMYIAHKDEDKLKELKAEQAEQSRNSQHARVRMDRSSHSYITDHMRSVKQAASRVWMCDECGTRNEDEPGVPSDMCHSCGSVRKAPEHDGSMFGPLHEHSKHLSSSMLGESPVKQSSYGTSTPARDPVYWKCETCSFLNEPSFDACEICHSERDQLHSSYIVRKQEVVIPLDSFKQSNNQSNNQSINQTNNLSMSSESFKPVEQSATPVKSARRSKVTPPSTASPGPLLLSSDQSKQAKTARRPRMRLKTMDVKDIVWFDEEGNEQVSEQQVISSPAKRPTQAPKIKQDTINISDDELSELSTRLLDVKRKPVNAKSDRAQKCESLVHPIKLDADWLEAPELSDTNDIQTNDDEDDELQRALQLSLAVTQPPVEKHSSSISDFASLDIVHAADDIQFDDAVWEDDEESEALPAVHTVLPVNDDAVVLLPTGDLAVSPALQIESSANSTAIPSVDIEQSATNSTSPVLDDHSIKDVLVMQQPDQSATSSHITDVRSPSPTLPPVTSAQSPESTEMMETEESVTHSPAFVKQPESGSEAIITTEVPAVDSSANHSHAQDFYESKYDEEAESKYDEELGADMDMSQQNSSFANSLASVNNVEPVLSSSSAQPVTQRSSPQQPTAVDLTMHDEHDEPQFTSLSAEANYTSTSFRSTASHSTSQSPTEQAMSTRDPAKFWSSAAQNSSNYVDSAEADRLSKLAAESLAVQSNLNSERARTERQAQQVTTTMFEECKELLTLFGCPYIDSPAEAEAQCAELEMIGLVDGIVTEDSDVFLFGASEVYRNIFESKKYAERYKTGEVEAKLGLTRESMISLALLLGSDYTAGIHGIGIVNGMEIINAFHIPGQGNAGLVAFREWCFADTVEKRPVMPVLEQEPPDESDDDRHEREMRNAELIKAYRTQLFKYKHRNIRRVWHITRDFPSDEIRQGYEEPMVDSSREPLSWSKPRWDDIIEFLKQKFRADHDARQAMSNSASVLDDMEDEWLAMVNSLRKSWEEEDERARDAGPVQNRLDMYFDENDQFAEIRSRRINQAVRGLTSKSTVALLRETEMEDEAKAQTRRGRGKSKVASSTRGKRGRGRGGKRARDQHDTEQDDDQRVIDPTEIEDYEAVAALEEQMNLNRPPQRKKAKSRRST